MLCCFFQLEEAVKHSSSSSITHFIESFRFSFVKLKLAEEGQALHERDKSEENNEEIHLNDFSSTIR